MHAAVKTQTINPGRQIAPPSRLIPGARPEASGGARKKSASATVDGRFWDWQCQHDVEETRKDNVAQAVARMVLPSPSVYGPHWSLARQVMADFLLISISFAGVDRVRAALQLTRGGTGAFEAPGLLLLYGALFTLLGFSERLYQPDTVQDPERERAILGKVVFWSAALVTAGLAWSRLQLIPLTTLVVSAPFNFLLMRTWRNWRRQRMQSEKSGRDVHNVLIVGAGQQGRNLAAHMCKDISCRYSVVGFVDDDQPLGGDVLGRVDELARIARTNFIDEVILIAGQPPDLAKLVIREARRNQIDVKIVPDLFGFEPDEPCVVERFGNIPVITLREEQMPAFSLAVKRTADAVSAAAALTVTVPLLTAIAVAIKLESPGPILYQAQRVGLKGRRFRCHKFRTMAADADQRKEHLRAQNERQGAFFKMSDDPRITRVGRVLRRYSLDELPQLWNVVRGDMSLVGPRPHPLDDFERYGLGDLQRLNVPPGLTGLWQVTARQDPSFERGLALDLEYIRSWTLWRDFSILWRTVAVVLRGSGV